jgi:hypothetical protein
VGHWRLAVKESEDNDLQSTTVLPEIPICLSELHSKGWFGITRQLQKVSSQQQKTKLEENKVKRSQDKR